MIYTDKLFKKLRVKGQTGVKMGSGDTKGQGVNPLIYKGGLTPIYDPLGR